MHPILKYQLERRVAVANGAECSLWELRGILNFEEDHRYECVCCKPAQEERIRKLRERRDAMMEQLKDDPGVRKAWICTVEILLDGDRLETKNAACDAMSNILADADASVLDWRYVTMSGISMDPHEVLLRGDYEEGQFLKARVDQCTVPAEPHE